MRGILSGFFSAICSALCGCRCRSKDIINPSPERVLRVVLRAGGYQISGAVNVDALRSEASPSVRAV